MDLLLTYSIVNVLDIRHVKIIYVMTCFDDCDHLLDPVLKCTGLAWPIIPRLPPANLNDLSGLAWIEFRLDLARHRLMP